MARKTRTKRRITKQSELLQILKYLIPKAGVKSVATDINPLAFQSRGGYLSPYLIPSAEQKVVHEQSKAYITIKNDGPGIPVDNKTVPDTVITPSGDAKTDIKRKEKFVKEQFALRGLPVVRGAVTTTYGGGNFPKTYEAITNGTFNWIGVKEYIDTHPQPEKKQKPEKKNN